ncbi:MAG: GWxTD domain-containing protein [Ignavibacteria bacterium]|nr:GWxTD domain-containing protein [Ignavibacteria bacterium]
MTFRSLSFIGLVTLGLCHTSPARTDQEQRQPRMPAQPVWHEVITLFGEDTTKAVINVHYRIGESFFIFVRNERGQQRSEYVARGELVVELLNEQKISAAREIRQISIARTSAMKEDGAGPDVVGAISFTVAPGTYTVVFGVDDKESGRSFLDRDKRVTARTPNLRPLEVSSPVMLQTIQENLAKPHVNPVNRGGEVVFGGRGAIFSQILLPDSLTDFKVRWALKGQLDGFGPRSQEFGGSDFVIQNGLPTVTSKHGSVQYEMLPSASRWAACIVPLPFELLEPGLFVLDVEYLGTNVKNTQTQSFRVTWPGKPFSLANVELAIDALRHIASEDEINAMQAGSLMHRAGVFHEFWKARDPDTMTAYNEVMAEYYYRVDEALRKFSTVREGDGYRTDRGRIYILYGPSPAIDRVLRPGSSPMEIWTYEALKKRFVFIDPNKNGIFILSQVENL